MPQIYLIQLLCPSRHAILAAPFDNEKISQEAAMSTLERIRGSHCINPWCAICGSAELKYETARTKFKDLAEANAALKESETANIASRIYLDGIGATHDSQAAKRN